jgi:hypothetical protein
MQHVFRDLCTDDLPMRQMMPPPASDQRVDLRLALTRFSTVSRPGRS